MPTDSWLNGVSGDWNTQTLWSTGTVANGAAVDAVIMAPEVAGSYTVAIDPNTTFLINSLTLDPGLATSGITDAGVLSVNGEVVLDNGVFGLAGTLGAAHLDIAQGGALSGSGTVDIGADLTDDGIISQSGGPLTVIANTLTLSGGQLDAGNGLLTLQARSFFNLAGGTLTGGNYEVQNGGTIMLPQNAGITSLRQADLFLLASGTIAYFDSALASTQPIQATLQTIDQQSAIQIVGGATFAAQSPLSLGGQAEIVDGVLSAPSMTIAATGLVFGVGTAATTNGLLNNGTILSGTGIASSLGEAVGDLVLVGPVTGTGALVANVGTLELTTGSPEAVTVLGGATLRIDAPITPGGTLYAGQVIVAGFTQSAPATIDLPNVAEAGLTPIYADGAVTLMSGAALVAQFDLPGSYQQGDFTLADDGGGGADLIIACYAAGTRIRTPAGEVAVEVLHPGDLVLTAGGAARPITWLGHRHICCASLQDPSPVWPVVVRAGAFADGVPRRDLWLSPDHAVFSDGVLIPVKHLINGTSIAQVATPAITYFHVELARHDVILAEGLPAETYLDTGNRAMFANGAAHAQLHPDFTALSWDDACAPLVTSGPEVAILRNRLARRLRKPSGPVCLRLGPRTLRPVRSHGNRHYFLSPVTTGTAHLDLTSGLVVAAIVIDGRPIQPALEIVVPPRPVVIEITVTKGAPEWEKSMLASPEDPIPARCVSTSTRRSRTSAACWSI